VSLTVTQVEDVKTKGKLTACRFSVNLIPHTVAVTTLKHLRAGEQVNLEIDTIARYLERMLSLNA
jgi:riboflavin synthase